MRRGQLFAPTIAADPPAAPRELSLEEAAIYPCKVANQGTACYLLYRALARWYVNPRTAGVLSHLRTAGGGGGGRPPPPENSKTKKDSDKR